MGEKGKLEGDKFLVKRLEKKGYGGQKKKFCHKIGMNELTK